MTKSARQFAGAADLLENISDGFAAYDGELNAIYVNRVMANFYGLTPQEMLGKNVSNFVNKPENMRYFRKCLEEHVEITYETHHEGRDRWYDVRLYPTADGVLVYSRDVTERKRHEIEIQAINADLERRVEERTRQLEYANKELESFAYSVSHDLRAPLRAIDGFSQAIEEDAGDKLDEGTKKMLGRVRSGAARMGQLIDALLGLAKVARYEIVNKPVDLSREAASILNELRATEPERAVEVRIEPDLIAYGEPTLLRALLQNLIGNAWKFTKHTESPRITVGHSKSGEFFVQDNGAGFDMTYKNKLFGAFQRLHAQEEYEGTGIGLATVLRIVHRHGGTVRAESVLGEGATFYFTLPTSKKDP